MPNLKCRICNNDASWNQLGLCEECLDKYPGITTTIITEENSWVAKDGGRWTSGLGGAVSVKLGQKLREWN